MDAPESPVAMFCMSIQFTPAHKTVDRSLTAAAL